MTTSIETIPLTDVTLSCAVDGPPDAPLVILAHGFPDDASTFRAQVPALLAAGFRTAVPTMRGYLPSGTARSERYDVAHLGRDLVELASHLSPGSPARLVGHDWGALAGFAATALAPSRFSHLVTMAAPHLRAALGVLRKAQARRSWYVGLFQLPILAEALLRHRDHALIDALWRDWSPSYRPSAEELRSVKNAIAGREHEVLAYYRAALSPSTLFGESRRLLLTKTRVPSLHLHGEDDGCVGVECTENAERWYDAPYRLQRISGAGHFLQREKPDEVNAVLLDFLR